MVRFNRQPQLGSTSCPSPGVGGYAGNPAERATNRLNETLAGRFDPNHRPGIEGAAVEKLIDQFVVTTATGRDVTLLVYEEVAPTSASRTDIPLIVTEGWELVNEIAANLFQLRSGEIAQRNSAAAAC